MGTHESDSAERSSGVLDGARELRMSRGLKVGLVLNLVLCALHIYLSIDKPTRV